MDDTRYTTIPQRVRAAQWVPSRGRKAARLLGLLLDEKIRYTHHDDDTLELSGLGLVIEEGDWLVVHDDGTAPELVSDQDFRRRFTHAPAADAPARGSVTNRFTGSMKGGLLLQAGDVNAPLKL